MHVRVRVWVRMSVRVRMSKHVRVSARVCARVCSMHYTVPYLSVSCITMMQEKRYILSIQVFKYFTA